MITITLWSWLAGIIGVTVLMENRLHQVRGLPEVAQLLISCWPCGFVGRLAVAFVRGNGNGFHTDL